MRDTYSQFERVKRAVATLDALPAAVLAKSSLAEALEAGAAEAIHLLRGIVANGEKMMSPDKIDPRIYTTTMNCSTAAARVLVNLQLRLNEAVWRRGSGEDVLAGILKRVEEAEAREPPLHHRLNTMPPSGIR